MSKTGPPTLMIPARVTARELAAAIDREVAEVQAALRAREEPSSPEDVLGAELAISVARSLGVEAAVEPRDLALEQLYEYEARGQIDSTTEDRAGNMVSSVIENLDDLDGMIESVAERWSVARMPVIDRNIIRMGLHELLHEHATPAPVIMSEAVRLAQAYSTEKSASFVNGVLATLAKSIRETP